MSLREELDRRRRADTLLLALINATHKRDGEWQPSKDPTPFPLMLRRGCPLPEEQT